ncbi:GTP-binding protein [Streptomyces sp. NPDC002690]
MPEMSKVLQNGAAAPGDDIPEAAKILVAGGFGAGKTTLVSTVSEITPFHTEEILTRSSVGVDDLSGVERKALTTVAMDFGRITIHNRLALFLFGTPGQDRFWFMWDELAAGALCAIVLADTRRLDASFPAVDYFERRGVPFVVAVNCFDGARGYPAETVRRALTLGPDVPVLLCDVRSHPSVKEVLVRAVEYVLRLETRQAALT